MKATIAVLGCLAGGSLLISMATAQRARLVSEFFTVAAIGFAVAAACCPWVQS